MKNKNVLFFGVMVFIFLAGFISGINIESIITPSSTFEPSGYKIIIAVTIATILSYIAYDELKKSK